MKGGPQPAARGTDHGAFSGPYRLLTLAIVVSVTIFAFEGMAVSTAMPPAGAELGAGHAYGLAFSLLTTLQVLGTVLSGPWCDRAGPLPAVVIGLALFAAGAAICAGATAYLVFLLGRALAGLGTGLAIVGLYVIIGRGYPPALRPKVFTAISAAWILPSLLGPQIAVWLTNAVSWRLVFGVVAPPALIVAAFIWLAARRGAESVAALDPVDAADVQTHRRVAVIGMAVAATVGILQWGAGQLTAVVSWAGLLVVVGAVGVLLSAPRVLAAGTLTMRRGLGSVMAARGVLMAAFTGVVAFVPLYLTAERGTGLDAAGVALTVGALGWFVGSWVQGRARWEGRRWHLVTASGVALAVGLAFSTSVVALELPWWWLGVAQTIAGLGMGLGTPTTGVLALELAPPEDHGAASSSLTLSDSLGNVLGVSFASGVYAALHVTAGSDAGLYVVMWGSLAAVALLVVAAGARTRPERADLT